MVLARRRLLLAAAGLVSVMVSAVWMCTVPPHPQFRSGVLEMTAIDVGQGDSILLVSPQGKTLLVDAGGLPQWMHSDFDIGEDVVSPYLWSRGIHRLDAVAITPAHSDHMGGMAAVLANFHPRELWLGVESRSPELQKLLEDAKRLGVVVIHRKAGDNIELGGSTVSILAPASNFGGSTLGRNDDSLVMKISWDRHPRFSKGMWKGGKNNSLLESNRTQICSRSLITAVRLQPYRNCWPRFVHASRSSLLECGMSTAIREWKYSIGWSSLR